MICPKCGNQNDENARFCDQCGASLSGSADIADPDSVRFIGLRCKNCNGIMTADAEGRYMICPYCGSKELIIDNEKVALAKIRLQEEKERAQREEIKAAYEEEVASRRSFETGSFKRVLVVFAVLSSVFAVVALTSNSIISGIIAIAQAIFNLLAWLIGMQTIRVRRHNLPAALFVAGIMLILPYVFFFDTESTNGHTYKWNDSTLATLLDEPKPGKTSIYLSSDTQFAADVKEIKPAQYRDYVSSCKEKGFTEDSDTTSSGYIAFYQNGTKLELNYYDSLEEMSIRIIAPIKLGELYWPASKLTDMLPRPDSETGLLDNESNNSLVIYIGDTSLKAYADYVQRCIDYGFNVDYSRDSRSFSAENADGARLSVRYYGYNIMEIGLLLLE